MTEREKLQSLRIFLGGCEQEFSKALRDLSLMPPHHRAHAEETIQELTTALIIIHEGLQPGAQLPSLLQEKVHRQSGRFPSLEDLGLEPRIQRGGLRATEARLAELDALGRVGASAGRRHGVITS